MSDFPNGYLTTGNKPVINDVYKEAEEYLKEQKRQDNLYNDEGDIYESAVIYAFIAGAKRADQTIIDNVCKFIESNVREYHKSGVFHVSEFIKDLKKYVEE
ncbi:MAG: hypothetical protein IJM43_08105 [Bacteroidaceae bacterium]|nr:hypothetical protein [Bacteroidaceae bacterium]